MYEKPITVQPITAYCIICGRIEPGNRGTLSVVSDDKKDELGYGFLFTTFTHNACRQ